MLSCTQSTTDGESSTDCLDLMVCVTASPRRDSREAVCTHQEPYSEFDL